MIVLVKNKQFTDNMKKGTLIALSMGIGASAVLPGMLPTQKQSTQVYASDIATNLPAANTNPFTDASDESHYKVLTQRALFKPVGGTSPWKLDLFPLHSSMQATSLEEFDGNMYTTINLDNTGDVYRYDANKQVWEPLGVAGKPLHALVKTANGNYIAAGGYSNEWGEYYSLYSSLGDDSSFEKRIDIYRSGTSSTNPSNAGIFKAGVALEDETLMFGKSKLWTNIMTTTDDVNFGYKQQIYGDYEDVIYEGGKIVAVGNQIPSGYTPYGSIAVASPDGKFTVTKLGISENLKSVSYANGKYVAVGSTGSQQPVVYSSDDGVSWKKSAMPATTTGLNAVAWDEVNQRFVAAGRLGAMYMSLDGVDWVQINPGIASDVVDLKMIEDPTARLSLSHAEGNVVASFGSLVEGAASYEVLRDGKVVYSGSDLNFTDTETVGETKYTYRVNIKDADGTVIGKTTKVFTTPSYATLNVSFASGAVTADMNYSKNQTVSYEVVRNGEVIYEGNTGKFVDKSILGATDYNYELNVKDPAGNVLETESFEIKTPIVSPSKLQVESLSSTEKVVTWDGSKNPANTEYLVQAIPNGEVDESLKEVVTTTDAFESESLVLPGEGNWAPSSLNKKDGTMSLKSEKIGARGITTQTYTFDVLDSDSQAKVAFDYMVSSENYDYFRVVLNGTQIVRQAGLGTWKSIEKQLKPGKNTLMFEYKKDGSGDKGLDAAFVDNLAVTQKSDGKKSSGWIQANEHTLTGLSETTDYEISVVAKANGLQSETVVYGAVDAEAIALQAVTEALESLTAKLETTELTSTENIESVQAELDALRELVNALPEGETKTGLLAELNDLQELVVDARELLEVTGEVESLENSLPAELLTAEMIQEAKDALAVVEGRVDALDDSEAKTELEDRLEIVGDKIDLAEQILMATESALHLKEALVSLDTPEKVQAAKDALAATDALVNALPENDAKTALEAQLMEAKEAIEVAENILNAKEAVTAVQGNPTQTGVDNAVIVVNKLEDGDLKTDLSNKLEMVQQSIYLENATQLVEKAVDSLTQADMSASQVAVDTAKDALALVKDESSKVELVQSLQVVQDVIDAAPVQTMMESFREKLENIFKRPQKAEATALTNEYKAIDEEASSLNDGTIKDEIMNELAELKTLLDSVLKNGNHPASAPGIASKSQSFIDWLVSKVTK